MRKGRAMVILNHNNSHYVNKIDLTPTFEDELVVSRCLSEREGKEVVVFIGVTISLNCDKL